MICVKWGFEVISSYTPAGEIIEVDSAERATAYQLMWAAIACSSSALRNGFAK